MVLVDEDWSNSETMLRIHMAGLREEIKKTIGFGDVSRVQLIADLDATQKKLDSLHGMVTK